MNETKWRVSFVRGDQGYSVLTDDDGPRRIADYITDESNAHLIAAAPDLAEALERIVDSVARTASGDVCQTYDFDDARSALSRARGATT